jgi:membrane associated rhomboid family serine protease
MQSFSLNMTLVLIAATCLVSYFAWQDRSLLDKLMLWPPAIARRGEWYRLLSYGFVHADGAHLLFNMITLYFFGGLVERLFAVQLGPIGYVLFYLGGIVVSILPTYTRHRDDPSYRSLGASGAVSAVLFTFILVQPWSLIFIFFIPCPAIVYGVLYVGYSIWMDRRGQDNVNHSAHLWGAAYGIAVSLVIEPRLLGVFLSRLFNPSFNF